MTSLPTIRVGSNDIAYRAEGSGDTLLLVHGFPLDHSMWHHQLDALASKMRVIAPDLPGFGRSSPIEGTHTMAAFADDLAGMLDALQIEGPVVFCGLSMGGYIGWEFWRKHGQRMRALIVCDSRAIADDDVVKKGRALAAGRVLREGVHVVNDAMLPKLFSETFQESHPQQVNQIKKVMEATPADSMAAALRGMANRDDFSGRLGEIDKPTLVVCGERDVISPAAEMRQMAVAIPDARYVGIARAGHMAPLERPQAVNAAILDFLEEV